MYNDDCVIQISNLEIVVNETVVQNNELMGEVKKNLATMIKAAIEKGTKHLFRPHKTWKKNCKCVGTCLSVVSCSSFKRGGKKSVKNRGELRVIQ